MKKILAATLALSVFATAGAASAQSYGGRGDYGRYDQSRDYGSRYQGSYDRYDSRDDRAWDRGESRYDQRGYGDRYEQRASRRYSAGRYQAPRGYQTRQWHRGDRMPSAYRGNAYVVDYRRYGLNAPPRGYQYVRSGNDAVLAAVATGVIASVIVSLFQ
jgi:Ni/Co efflux regulator RcnB